MIFLFSGCQKDGETEQQSSSNQKERQTKDRETESRVRAAFTEETLDAIVVSEDTYDYVALGNSVTCNEIDGILWWGSWGMACIAQKVIQQITIQNE